MKTIANEFWVPDSNLGRTAHPWLLTSILSQSNITRPLASKLPWRALRQSFVTDKSSVASPFW